MELTSWQQQRRLAIHAWVEGRQCAVHALVTRAYLVAIVAVVARRVGARQLEPVPLVAAPVDSVVLRARALAAQLASHVTGRGKN